MQITIAGGEGEPRKIEKESPGPRLAYNHPHLARNR